MVSFLSPQGGILWPVPAPTPADILPSTQAEETPPRANPTTRKLITRRPLIFQSFIICIFLLVPSISCVCPSLLSAERYRSLRRRDISARLQEHSAKKPILSFERMGRHSSERSFGSPATILQVFGFAPCSFEQFALFGFVLLSS